MAIGCGCLSIILLLFAAVGGFFVFSSPSDSGGGAEENGILSGVFGGGDDSGGGILGGDGGIISTIASSATGTKQKKLERQMEAKKKSIKEMEEATSATKIRSYLEKPLSKDDLEKHLKFVSDWETNPVRKKFKGRMKGLDKLNGDEKSVANQLKVANASTKMATAAMDLAEAYNKHILKHGGYEAYSGRIVRIGGVIAASNRIKSTHKKLKDADSDAVSKQMLTERAEVASEYKKLMKEAKKSAAGNSKAGLGALAMMGRTPGTIALARMPQASFKIWDRLPVKQRKKIRESISPEKSILGGGFAFGMGSVNPSVMMLKLSAAETQAFNRKKK